MTAAMKTVSATDSAAALEIQPLVLRNRLIMMKSITTKSPEKAKTARSWIETTFQKRECICYVPNPKDEHLCCCGLSRPAHGAPVSASPPGEIWHPTKHTQGLPTDAYGTVEFQGGPHPTKAQYVRLSFDSRPELISQLLTREWALERPKLLISIQGGKANFELQPKLKKVLRKGLLKAAKTTGAWIFTGGTNTGVTKQVGDALQSERSQRAGRVVSIGVAPWGVVEGAPDLIGRGRDVPYHAIASPRSKFAVLNNRHAYFLLVDNGSVARYGAEIMLRRRLEKYLAAQKLHPFTHSSTPIVCLVIEGGTNTVRAVLEYVTDTPPVPVVVCDGSGRAADLIAFVHKYASENGEQTVLESMKEYLINTIQKTFEVGLQQAECLYGELLQCTRKKNLITVFRIQERAEGGEGHELDQTILTALFRSQHLSASEQLSLALTWNRVDIARSEIFVYGQEWPPGALDEAMMQALEHDRIDFVKLLLENGVSMRRFLTIPRLEELYNTRGGPGNTLGHILRDLRPHIPRGYIYTLHDIGLVINKLMGGAYRSYYTRRKFRPIYAKVMNKNANVHRNSASFARHGGAGGLSLVTGFMPVTKEMALFDYPFNELLMWAVLTKRHQMALLMWTHGEEALAKSLAACKLYKAMAHEAAEDDLETEVYEELRAYGKEFETKALELLDFCYRQDDDQAQQLLTCELHNWSGQTCLSLAVAANHRALLAHPCSQIILADLWMGGLRTRKNTNLKVILGLLCPLYILQLEFKSKEELQLMPQTEEEHLENESLEDDRSEKDKNPDAEALISDGGEYETRLSHNGKVCLDGRDLQQTSFYEHHQQYNEVRQNRPLRLKKKIYEFFTSPITKFWADSLAYMIFLMMFTYTVLVGMDMTPSWQEMYSIAYIATLGCEKIREIVSSEPVAISHKFSVWAWNMWNPCDAATIILFMVGLILRLRPSTMDIGRVIYCVDSIYWYLRILNILGVNKYLGPLVTMMGKMVKNMIYFVVLLLVVLMSFGVARQAILFPHSDANWRLVREVFYQPYFMLYGEVFADDIDPPCGTDPSLKPCETGRWITPMVMSMYLLVANILLINLLIAVFNNIFNEVNAISHQVWMFQRFTVVMEYEQKPVLPPPLILLSHIWLIFRWLKRKTRGARRTYDNGLKLFLEKDDMERLYDFEEECVEGYFREQEIKLNQSTEERVRCTNDRMENVITKVEDINQKENLQITSIQNAEFRLRKLEDIAEQTLNHLAVIHRFMATHPQLQRGSTDTLAPPAPTHVIHTGQTSRLRTASDKSEILSEGEGIGRFLVRPVREEEEITEHGTEDGAVDAVDVDLLSNSSSDGEEGAQPPVIDVGIVPDTLGSTQVTLRQRSSESKETTDRSDEKRASGTDDAFTPGEQPAPESVPEYEITRPRTRTASATTKRANARRRSESGTENTSGPGAANGTHLAPRRQHSQTHSEPDNSAADAGSVHASITGIRTGIVAGANRMRAVNAPRSLLLAMHAEYTSITDELETVCGLLSPPRTPGHLLSPGRTGSPAGIAGNVPTSTGVVCASGVSSATNAARRRHASEMSNPEFALYMEKEHLRGAEEDDYNIMENLIQRRYDDSDETEDGEDPGISISVCVNTSSDNPHEMSSRPGALSSGEHYLSVGRGSQARHSLRRASAIDVKELPSPLQPLLDEDASPGMLVPPPEGASVACGEVLLPVPRQYSGNITSVVHMHETDRPRRESGVFKRRRESDVFE